MNTHAAFGFNEMLTFVIGDMARAVSERPGETKQQQYTRTQGSTAMILDLHPRDAAEAMLAGHCVMFNAVIGDSARETLRGEADTMRRATRSNLVALNKSFSGNLDRLERYHERTAKGFRHGPEAHADAYAAAPVPLEAAHVSNQPPHADPGPVAAAVSAGHDTPAPDGRTDLTAPPDPGRPGGMPPAVARDTAQMSTPTPIGIRFSAATIPAATIPAAPIPIGPVPGNEPPRDANRAPANARARFHMVADPVNVAPAEPPPKASAAASAKRDALPTFLRQDVIGFKPSVETIAACRANPEAMAALEAGDPVRFARAMGVAAPCEAYLTAAAAPGSPFDVTGSTESSRPDPSRPRPAKAVT